MNLIILSGPPASGKMTVGQELQKLTDYKLFYNHMSLELVNQFFDFGTPHFRRLDKKIRFDIFEEVAKSDLPGLIFTFVWAYNEKEDEEYVDHIVEIFSRRKPKVCFVELRCELEERLKRNKHPNRLAHKPSKRNTAFSDQLLLDAETQHRMNTLEGEFPDKGILTIENTYLSAPDTARVIADHFQLPCIN